MDSIIQLGNFIEKSTSPFHVVETVAKQLESNDFKELSMCGKWNLEHGKKYYVKMYDTSLVAFTVGNIENDVKLKIVSAHTDFPCFRIKPCADIKENGYHKLNTEVYGGPILNTWMDRPLSMSGRVCVKDKSGITSVLMDFEEPILTIPNLAIHMNRNVNKGVELNRQKDMLPLADVIRDELNNSNFVQRIAKKLCVDESEIIDYEMYVYQYEKGECIGFDKTLYSSPRLDNITSVCAATEAIIMADIPTDGINMTVFFDNEEIGSGTKQGAASNAFPMLLEKMMFSLGKDRQDYIDAVFDGFMLSVDVAHAVHPNSPEKSDVCSRPVLNGGVVIKVAANQSYAGDALASSKIRLCAEKCGTKCQTFVNKSDMQGGSTLGAIVSSRLPMRTLDIGIPLLAMHSAREIMGIDDQKSLKKLLTCYFS